MSTSTAACSNNRPGRRPRGNLPGPLAEQARRAMADTRPIRVRMENIFKTYGTIKALDDAGLVLRAGEVLGLVGDNGAGKSTLSKVLSGAVIPDEGRLFIEDR